MPPSHPLPQGLFQPSPGSNPGLSGAVRVPAPGTLPKLLLNPPGAAVGWLLQAEESCFGMLESSVLGCLGKSQG